MIGYATVGSNNVPRAAAFYDALLDTIGARRYIDAEDFVVWSASPGAPALGVIRPNDGKRATAGNGAMIALLVAITKMVDALHSKAMELGGNDEGQPGLRGELFYAAYFRDLDGNKICAFNMDGPTA